MPEAGWVDELFRSAQGEGIFAGALQIFVRFGGCSASCAYCDTPASRERSPVCRCEHEGAEVLLENPVGSDAVAAMAVSLAGSTPGIHSIAITGGEPLDQPDFLVALLEDLATCALPRYLETNGLDAEAARRAAPHVEIVSLDIKLPSLCPGSDTFAAAAEAIGIFQGTRLQCKVVLTDDLVPGEFDEAVQIVASVDPLIPFVIQPVTASERCRPPAPPVLLELAMRAGLELEDVRIIPQLHPVIGLR